MSRRVGLDIANQDSKTVIPDMISDGRRMRVVWRPGDGDGNPNQQIVTRYLNLVNGHPTWRIYTSNIKLPITRGSPEEPPHYCYLDDRACYAIYCSEAYTLKEKGEFWPSDFNKFGNIRKVRLNRGSKAYLEGSNMVLAQVKLRGLEKWYTFSGAPEVTEYEPSRPKQNAQIKGSVEQRYHEECERRVTHNTRFEKPVAEDAEPGVFPNETRTMLPTKQSLDEQYGSMYSSRNKISSPEVEVPAVLRSQQPIVQSSNASQQPTMTLSLSSTPKLSSPATSLGIPARLGTFNPKALLAKENAKRTNEGSPFTTNPRKRKLEATIDPNSVFLTDRTPRHSSTLVNNEVNGTEELSGVNQSKVINIDTNSDTELPAQVHLDAKESPDHLHLAKDEDLKHELEAVVSIFLSLLPNFPKTKIHGPERTSRRSNP
jgi:hypothetical protein